MQKDFHYYATYCAARIAGYSHEEGLEICYSSQLTDWCSVTFLKKLKGPKAAATTQLPLELADSGSDILSLQNITRIWSSFHFLPYDLNADVKRAGQLYKNKYRLICKPNGALVEDTVKLAKGRGMQAVGLAMHVVADTWAHSGFAGTPSLVINNTDWYFYELLSGEDGEAERLVRFRHSPTAADDTEQGIYTNSVYQGSENSIMNLGHGRAGHLPDYSFARYKYLPAWGDYEMIVKDNPSDYYNAFCQMISAMHFLRGDAEDFVCGIYDTESVKPWEERIRAILVKRQLDACPDWKALSEEMAGCEIEDFDLNRYEEEYLTADREEKNNTFLGRYFLAAMAQKSMVTGKIFLSGSLLAGFSADYTKKGFRGIRDYRDLVEFMRGRNGE